MLQTKYNSNIINEFMFLFREKGFSSTAILQQMLIINVIVGQCRFSTSPSIEQTLIFE